MHPRTHFPIPTERAVARMAALCMAASMAFGLLVCVFGKCG